ncbi:hypothetical protein PAAG_04635 [Paracoccidioides lutzii Pb01]|uniref:NAD-dependent epimerase/dehydratase domain-containing protein n=1 Tax=Paracoccidioides lutzii (strain ATCC MYA-826 / Pb01) TaxID=502779 RepID=C1H1J1_PARBA|nr:hypothetical protein PAAG_04635 [Paracoccidioides lutzii Pb01]EEH33585.2 hypothetical protein PAAG_04635 [Paracoccidioides lutzii Pb01]
MYDLPDTALHHAIDRRIMDASNEVIKTISICPPDIYGRGTGVGGRADVWRTLWRTKESFYVGAGENPRAVTHPNDVVDLFLLVLENIILKRGEDLKFGKELKIKHSLTRFYFAVADEIRWKDAAEAICRMGIEQGWLQVDAITAFYDEKCFREIFEPGWLGFVSLGVRQLGWKPRAPDFWTVLPADVERAVAQMKR